MHRLRWCGIKSTFPFLIISRHIWVSIYCDQNNKLSTNRNWEIRPLSWQAAAGSADDTRGLWHELSSLVWNIHEEICGGAAATEAPRSRTGERCTCIRPEWTQTDLWHRKIHLPKAKRLHTDRSSQKHKQNLKSYVLLKLLRRCGHCSQHLSFNSAGLLLQSQRLGEDTPANKALHLHINPSVS